MNIGAQLWLGSARDRRRAAFVRSSRYAAGVALIAVGYYGFAQAGEALLLTGPAGAFWPATGLGIAVLYLGGLRWWPGVLIGDLLSREFATLPLGTALAESGGNIARAVVAVIILLHMIGPRAGMDRLAHVGAVLVAVSAGEAISATVAMLALLAGGVIEASEMTVFWRSWWLGGLAGGLVVVPLAMAWARGPGPAWRGRGAWEGALMIAAVGGLSAVALSASEPVTYLVFPALIWAALRFGPQGATLAVVVAVVSAVWATSNELGPFLEQAPTDSALNLQLFIIIAALTTLCLAAIVSERRRDARELAESRDAGRADGRARAPPVRGRIARQRAEPPRRAQGQVAPGRGARDAHGAGVGRHARDAGRGHRRGRRRPAPHRAWSLAAAAGQPGAGRRADGRDRAQRGPGSRRGRRRRGERAAHRAGGVPLLPRVDPERREARGRRRRGHGPSAMRKRRARVQRRGLGARLRPAIDAATVPA